MIFPNIETTYWRTILGSSHKVFGASEVPVSNHLPKPVKHATRLASTYYSIPFNNPRATYTNRFRSNDNFPVPSPVTTTTTFQEACDNKFLLQFVVVFAIVIVSVLCYCIVRRLCQLRDCRVRAAQSIICYTANNVSRKGAGWEPEKPLPQYGIFLLRRPPLNCFHDAATHITYNERWLSSGRVVWRENRAAA